MHQKNFCMFFAIIRAVEGWIGWCVAYLAKQQTFVSHTVIFFLLLCESGEEIADLSMKPRRNDYVKPTFDQPQ